MYKVVNGKKLTWHHFEQMNDLEFVKLQEDFDISELHLERIHQKDILSEIDEGKKYLMISLPWLSWSKRHGQMIKESIYLFLFKDTIITVSNNKIDGLNRYLDRLSRSKPLRNIVLEQTSLYFLYRLLDYTYRELHVWSRELEREAISLENDLHAKKISPVLNILAIWRKNLNLFNEIIIEQVDIWEDILDFETRIFLIKDRNYLKQILGESKILLHKTESLMNSSYILTDDLKIKLLSEQNLSIRNWLSNASWLISFILILLATMFSDLSLWLGEWYDWFRLVLILAIGFILIKLTKVK